MTEDVDGGLALRLAAPFVGAGDSVAEEVGDGNLNVVWRVTGTERSVIVKHAPPYLHVVGDAWPLTQDRIRIESQALKVHGELAPGRGPTLLAVDSDRAALVLEDLIEHEVWRTALVRARHVEGVAEQMGRYCARTLLGTSDLVMDPVERKLLGAQFVNPELCSITEELVFTAPYVDADSNRVDPAAAEIAASLRRDFPLRRAAAQLLWEFRTRREALIHGDLHTGSIMVTDHDARVIDPEFACIGPMAYDTGNVVANLAFASLRHQELGNTGFVERVTSYVHDFWQALVEEIRVMWPRRQPWDQIFVASLLRDTGRYAATELVRRVVGLAHVVDIDSLDDDRRLRAQVRAVAGARSVTLGPSPQTLDDLWNRMTTKETD